MPQIRVYKPKDDKQEPFLKDLGFHWCNKHRRFEKNLKDGGVGFMRFIKVLGFEPETSDDAES